MLPSRSYQDLLNSLKGEIDAGILHARRMLERQIVITNWRVGRALDEYIGKTRSNANVQFMERISRDLDRPAHYFYGAVKFYRAYPCEPKESMLTWSHYDVLMRVKDEGRRKKYEQMVLNHGLGRDDLRSLVYEQKQKDKCARLSMAVKEKDKESPQLSVMRGRLFQYKIVGDKKTPLSSGMVFVDIGFGILREVPIDLKNKIHAGYYLRVVKYKERYVTRLSGGDENILFTYKGFLERVVDGDTLIMKIDCGFRTWVSKRVRLRGIDTPEIGTIEGRKAKQFVEDAISRASVLIVKTYKVGKYGRYIVDIFYSNKECDPLIAASKGNFLNQELLDAGMAKLWKG